MGKKIRIFASDKPEGPITSNSFTKLQEEVNAFLQALPPNTETKISYLQSESANLTQWHLTLTITVEY